MNTPFLFGTNCAYNRGGLNPTYTWLQFVHLYCVWCCCCCCPSVYRPHFERACSARQPDIGSKSLSRATYHANNSLNCARIADVCRMREVCDKNRLGRNNCELIGSKPTSQSREKSQFNGVGVDTPCGSTREIIVIVPALLGL